MPSIKLNTLFIIFLLCQLITSQNQNHHKTYEDINSIIDLSKEKKELYYFLIISPNKSDKDIVSKSNQSFINEPLVRLAFSHHKEINYPTVYFIREGILQYRKKIALLTKELDSFINDNITIIPIVKIKENKNKTASHAKFKTTASKNIKNTETKLVSLKQMTIIDTNKEDHLKKVITAIIVVFLLSISIVLVIKYSIDWALSSRLDFNLEKEIKKKEAIDSLMENTNANIRDSIQARVESEDS